MEEQVSDQERLSEPSKAVLLTAKIGICCQFAAVVRILGELIWHHHRGAGDLSTAGVDIYLIGAGIAAVLGWVSVIALWLRRVRFSIAVAAATVLVLLAIKLWAVH